jgi:spermidine synthase
MKLPQEGYPPSADTWFTEYHSPNSGIYLKVKRPLFSGESAFQKVEVFESKDFGNVLVLDGAIQTTEGDEFIYHEMLTHVPLCAHPGPRRVLIVGGGDGGCVREALRHPGVEEVTLVEIDQMVIDCARKFFPGISSGLNDPRVRVEVRDGVKFVRGRRRAFDVIIVDSTDPVAMASPLSRTSFFRAAKEALRPGGIYAAQAQGPVFEGRNMARFARAIRKVFPRTDLYLAGIPTYPGGIWGFALSARGRKRPSALPPRPLPRGAPVRFYSQEIHRAAFVLPPYIRDILG